jgi:hypothetical protein
MVELTQTAHKGRDWPMDCLLALVNVSIILKSGDKVRFRKTLSPTKVEVEFVYQTWDFRHLSIGLKVGTGEPVNDFWSRLQKALGEEIEPAEDYIAWYRGAPAASTLGRRKEIRASPNRSTTRANYLNQWKKRDQSRATKEEKRSLAGADLKGICGRDENRRSNRQRRTQGGRSCAAYPTGNYPRVLTLDSSADS